MSRAARKQKTTSDLQAMSLEQLNAELSYLEARIAAIANRGALAKAFQKEIALIKREQKARLRPCITPERLEVPYAVAYDSIVGSAPAEHVELVKYLHEELPHSWLHAYKRMCSAPTNVLLVAASGFEYMFDYSSEVVANGEAAEDEVQEDRVVAAHGVSRPPASVRNSSRLPGFPSSTERGDRGHFLAHSAGGGLEINIFHQVASLNRGWSESGKRYRAMERYCAGNPGTYFFSRPIYRDRTARPTLIEFGILKPDRTLWVELFANVGAG